MDILLALAIGTVLVPTLYTIKFFGKIKKANPDAKYFDFLKWKKKQ